MKKYICLALILFLAGFLRFYHLDQNPPSLYWDETSLAYNAFTIFTAGVDEHGEHLPLARFTAFGDNKAPGYIYSIVPFYALFGIGEFAVRFPSALAGVLMVLLTYGLVILLTENPLTALTASFLLAVSPWSLQLSRGAFEANLAALFNASGILFFILGTKKRQWLIVSAVFFAASFYTFNSNRIIMPLVILFLSVLYWRKLLTHWKWVAVSFLLGVMLLIPMFIYLQTPGSRTRFQEVSIFTDLKVIEKSNARIARDGNTWWAKIIHNRRLYYAKEFLRHYTDEFKGQFLFITGDANFRLSTQDSGELYLFELPFLLGGLLSLIRVRSKLCWLLLGWVFIAIIPSSVARETPHMLRSASILPVYQIITALGLINFWAFLKRKNKYIQGSIIAAGIVVITFSLVYYLHNYWVHYPIIQSSAWQYGYKQMILKVKELEPNYDDIFMTDRLGRAYIYYLFYNKVDPQTYLATRDANSDFFGFWNVYSIGKYHFSTELPSAGKGKQLFIATSQDNKHWAKLIEQIKSPSGEVVFEIGEL